MKKLFAIFLCGFLSCYCRAQDELLFDYSRTGWILHKIDDAAVIYKRPAIIDYEERNLFILVYSILHKYLPPTRDLSQSTPDNSAIVYQLIFISPNNQQRLLLGDHWISDEKSWAPISEHDYQQLRSWMEGRIKAEGLDNIQRQKLKPIAVKFQQEFESDFLPWDEYLERATGAIASSATSSSINSNVATSPAPILPHPAQSASAKIPEVKLAEKPIAGSGGNINNRVKPSRAFEISLSIFVLIAAITLILVRKRKR